MGGISIFSAKEQAQTYQPLLLCRFEFSNGQFLYVSTHPLGPSYLGTPTAGSYKYMGNEWLPRILNQDIAATQAMSDLGFDIPPQVTVSFADPDKVVYLTYENQLGFKGAILTVYAAMWDVGNSMTGSFNSDTPIVKFIGVCSSPSNVDEGTLTVTATSLLNMTQQQMPPVRIQPLCAWSFPFNLSARTDGISSTDSPFYQCGYSPDLFGGVGNYESGTACFASCDLSSAACIERLGNTAALVPILQDTSNRSTGRFGGFDYMPVQNNGLQRSYVTGQWELIVNATNEARYGDYIPQCYGTTWIQPEIMGVYGDGNYTNFECMLCFGVVEEITQLIVAGVVVAQLYSPSSSAPVILSPAYTTDYQDNYWVSVNNGLRNGNTNNANGWSNKGDPYGSVAAIAVQALSTLASPSSLPQVQALVKAGLVRVDTGTIGNIDYTTGDGFSSNPVWILLDLLVSANWRYSDVNIQSFIDAAAVCDTQIYFNRLDGTYSNVYNEPGSPPYLRYSVGFTIKQRTSIGEVIRGVRNAFRGMLFFDFSTGLLTVMCKQTIADQQPNPITGSNYNTPVSSVTAAGVSQTGYVAYLFDGTSIRKTDSGKSTLRLYQRQTQETPNKVTTYFFDRENQYNQDISTIIDTEDVDRIGAEISGTFNLIGPQTYDHINRVTDTWFSENYRGNPRLDYEGSFIGDTGGTIMAEFETSVKAIHLMVGHIVLLTDAQTGLSMQPMRVVKIQPSQNFETAKVTLQWHNDNWYQDTYGQGANQPIYKNTMSAPDRLPYPLRAGFQSILTSPYYDPTELFYHLGAPLYGGQQSPELSYPSQMLFQGFLPPNAFQSTPRMPKLAITATASVSGSYPTSASFFMAVASTTSSASFTTASFENAIPLSALSNVAVGFLPEGFHELEFSVQAWPDNPVGFYVFAGTNSQALTFQFSGTGTPAGIDLSTSFKVAAQGAPDIAYNALRFRNRLVQMSGICELTFLPTASFSSGTTSIKVAMYEGTSFPNNSLAGREVSYLGCDFGPQVNGGVDFIMDIPIMGNDADTLYLEDSTSTFPHLSDIILENFLTSPTGPAIFSVRMTPTYGSDSGGNYIEDALMANAMAPIASFAVVTDATDASPIVITYDGPGGLSNGQWVVIQGVLGNTAANGQFQLASVSGNTAQLVGSTGNGAFAGNGIVFSQTFGLVSGNNLAVFIFAGTGRNTLAPILSVGGNKIYIQGDWPVTPDSTSRMIIISMDYITDQATSQISIPTFGQVGSFYTDTSAYPKNTSVLVEVAKQSFDGVTLSSPVLDQYREIMVSNRYLFDWSFAATIPGVLAIGSNQAPPMSASVNMVPIAIVVLLDTAASGSPITVNINCGGALVAAINVAAGETLAEGNMYLQTLTGIVSVASVSLFPTWARLLAGRPITVDIVAVGSTAPGSDLTVVIFCINE